MPTVLILGASSDIGYAIAKQFASQNYTIQLAGRNIQQLQSFQTDIHIRYNVSCTLHPFDATHFEEHQNFYNSLSPKPDVSIYVAGYMTDNDTAIQNWNETLKTIHTNYTGAVSVFNIIASDYKTKRAGTLIGISSVAGNRGRQSNYIYGSAKSAFSTYLSGLRNKMYHHHVHVMTVLPGFVYTRMTEHLNLPPLLTAMPQTVAAATYSGMQKRENIIYVKWFWRWIMLAITLIPEALFKKQKL